MSTEVVLGMICLAVQGSTVIATQQVPDTPQRREITTDARRLANKNKKKGNPRNEKKKKHKKDQKGKTGREKGNDSEYSQGGKSVNQEPKGRKNYGEYGNENDQEEYNQYYAVPGSNGKYEGSTATGPGSDSTTDQLDAGGFPLYDLNLGSGNGSDAGIPTDQFKDGDVRCGYDINGDITPCPDSIPCCNAYGICGASAEYCSETCMYGACWASGDDIVKTLSNGFGRGGGAGFYSVCTGDSIATGTSADIMDESQNILISYQYELTVDPAIDLGELLYRVEDRMHALLVESRLDCSAVRLRKRRLESTSGCSPTAIASAPEEIWLRNEFCTGREASKDSDCFVIQGGFEVFVNDIRRCTSTSTVFAPSEIQHEFLDLTKEILGDGSAIESIIGIQNISYRGANLASQAPPGAFPAPVDVTSIHGNEHGQSITAVASFVIGFAVTALIALFYVAIRKYKIGTSDEEHMLPKTRSQKSINNDTSSESSNTDEPTRDVLKSHRDKVSGARRGTVTRSVGLTRAAPTRKHSNSQKSTSPDTVAL